MTIIDAKDSAEPVSSEDMSPGARAAQDRLAEAFGHDQEDQDSAGDVDADQADLTEDEQGDAQSTVVTLGDDVSLPSLDDNPFAKEMADAAAARKVEALLFASPKPLSEAFLSERVGGVDVGPILSRLVDFYDPRGVNLRQVDGKWQFVTAPDVADVLVDRRTAVRKLSRAALETLSIIAYHQPCSRADIEEVRGVAVAKGSLDQLLEIGWIRLRGRRDAPGRPVLYGTTPAFLEHFGLGAISDLPGASDLKAAGLLDARLPPGFQVPTPKSEDDEDQAAAIDVGEDGPAFTEDFLDGDERTALTDELVEGDDPRDE